MTDSPDRADIRPVARRRFGRHRRGEATGGFPPNRPFPIGFHRGVDMGDTKAKPQATKPKGGKSGSKGK